MSVGPIEALALDPVFDAQIMKWLDVQEASLNRTLRAYSRRWKSEEAAAVISNVDGALMIIEKLKKHLSAIVLAERAAATKTILKEMKRA